MEKQPELKRTLGLTDATMLVAGSMIGSGIFIVSSDMARTVGSPGILLLLWLITGFITITAALSYGELAGMMPKAGGQFVYIQRAFGNKTAFVYGWSVFTVIQSGVIAAVAMAFANYSSVFFPVLNTVLFPLGKYTIYLKNILAVLSLILLTYINTRGVQNGRIVQLVFTSAKLIALFALIVLGISMGIGSDAAKENFSNMWNASSSSVSDGVLNVSTLGGMALIIAMGATIINSLFSSDAWNNVTFIAGEIKEPQKNIPRSLFLGTLIVTIIYILANVAYLCLLPLKGDPNGHTVLEQGIQFATNDRVGAAAATVLFGNAGALIMAALIMVSTFGCNNGLILAGARVYYAMANEGLFFKKAATLNKAQVPQRALIIQCIWACLLCFSGTYKDLVSFSTFASMIFYIVTIAGIFVLRKKEPNTPRPYKALAYPTLPALYILLALGVCISLIAFDTRNTLFAIGVVILGIPMYYFTSKKDGSAA